MPKSDAESYEKTMVLLTKAQRGDESARDLLYRRLIPRLERYAHGRVPPRLRNVSDTQEIVQETVVRSLPHLDRFRPQHEGSLMQYLKQTLINRVRDLARRSGRETPMISEELIPSDKEPSPVEQIVGKEALSRFETALVTLKEDQRMAVSLHVEMGYDHHDLAQALDRNPEAARKVLFRGLKNLADKMKAAS